MGATCGAGICPGPRRGHGNHHDRSAPKRDTDGKEVERQDGKEIEIIWVSNDSNEEDYRKNFATHHGNWVAVPWTPADGVADSTQVRIS